MNRDMDLIREILLAIEASGITQGTIDLHLPAYDPELVSYHVKLLSQAGLITATDLSTMHGFEWAPKSLTWAGHEQAERDGCLSSVRDRQGNRNQDMQRYVWRLMKSATSGKCQTCDKSN